MNYAMLVAEILGPVYLAVGVGMLVSCDHYKKMFDEVMKSKTMMYFGGVLALVVGILILRVHSMWMQGWTVLVTLVGWLAVLKGLCLLVIPEQFMSWNKWVTQPNGMMFAKVVALVLGLVFTYFGYFV